MIEPPCNLTISFAMAKPKPVPPFALAVDESAWVNLSKTASNISLDIPNPRRRRLHAQMTTAAIAAAAVGHRDAERAEI